MLLALAVCSLNRQYLIPVTVCSLCKRAWSLLVESMLVPAVIPDLADNWICAAARQLFEIRAVTAIFVSVPGNNLRSGHFLQSSCYHRDFERLALFTASLILICVEIWPRLALCLPSPNLCCACSVRPPHIVPSHCVRYVCFYKFSTVGCFIMLYWYPAMFPSQSAFYASAVVINLQ